MGGLGLSSGILKHKERGLGWLMRRCARAKVPEVLFSLAARAPGLHRARCISRSARRAHSKGGGHA